MEGLIDSTLTLLTDPVALLIFACAMGGGLVAGIIPGLSTTALAVIVLPLTAAQPLPYVMVMYGTLFISGVAGRHLAHAEDGRQTASPNLRRSAVPSSATFRVVLIGVIGAMLAVLLTEGLAGYVFFGFKAPEARQIRSNFRRRLAAFNHGAPACVGTLEAARCRIWLRSCRLIALSFDARGGDGVIWA